MRILTPEYLKELENDEMYNYIVNTPKPDFTQLDKDCKVFAAWLAKEHEKDRAMLRKWHEEENGD
jgi:hypothetical protein